MALVDLTVPSCTTAVPRDVRAFIREARRRIDRFQRPNRIPGFVPCDFESAYNVLRGLAAAELVGNLLCEWGSGFGVVACLAAMLDYDAFGVEIEWELVKSARRLAADFELPVEFACCSFIPPGAIKAEGEYAWLTTDAGSAEEELGLGVADFDVIFAYPWPDEEQLVGDLFERHAAAGAVLLTYHGGEEFRLRRKTANG